MNARACAKVGRFELAATYYHQALERQPGNWVLLNEISLFLTFSLRDLKAGIDMAKMALALNPTLNRLVASLANPIRGIVRRLDANETSSVPNVPRTATSRRSTASGLQRSVMRLPPTLPFRPDTTGTYLLLVDH